MDQSDVIVSFEYGELFFEICRFPCVVCIEKCDQLAGRFTDAAIACGTDTSVVLAYIPDVIAECCDNCCGVICRAVVYNDDLRWRMRLLEDAADRVCDESSVIISRNYD
jgi:hypothetical protein